MATWRNYQGSWTEFTCVADGEVLTTTCCCTRPGGTRRACADSRGNKTACRCHCHTIAKKAGVTGETPDPATLPECLTQDLRDFKENLRKDMEGEEWKLA